jgi:hypothetical protein
MDDACDRGLTHAPTHREEDVVDADQHGRAVARSQVA